MMIKFLARGTGSRLGMGRERMGRTEVPLAGGDPDQ